MSGNMGVFTGGMEDLASALFGSRSAGVCVIQEGLIKSVNPLLEEIMGLKAEDLQGRPWCDLIHADDRGLFLTGPGKSAGITDSSLNFRIMTQDGGSRWMTGTFTPTRFHTRPALLALLADVNEHEKVHEEFLSREEDLLATTEGTFRAIEKIVEMKDPFIVGHQRRVARLSFAIASHLGFSEASAKTLRMAALVHDVGKVSIPIQVLAKPMHLSDDEYSIVRLHPMIGYEILKDIENLAYIGEIILQHHERIDGSGYPSGLTGDKMLPEAKIICVADVVEAMVSQRPHRPAQGMEEALAEIRRERGKSYDADVVDACVALFHDQGFTLEAEAEGAF
ncbi:MAG: HD domain-containing protein [Thermovirgaceae bacterium]|nr:HD domain-containing protein [Thermovirgaceae bacterium]